LVLVGRVSSNSLVTTVCRRTFCTSTTGAAPVTVIDSDRFPTCMMPSMLAVNPEVRTTPSRLTVWNPSREKVTV
jgi:hypothetical protein